MRLTKQTKEIISTLILAGILLAGTGFFFWKAGFFSKEASLDIQLRHPEYYIGWGDKIEIMEGDGHVLEIVVIQSYSDAEWRTLSITLPDKEKAEELIEKLKENISKIKKYEEK